MRWREILYPGRLSPWSALGAVAGLGVCFAAVEPASAQTVAPGRAAVARPVRDPAVRRSGDERVRLETIPAEAPPPATGAREAEAPRIEVTHTVIRTEPAAVPGARLALQIDRAVDGARFEWVQVSGPSVEIANPREPAIQITIPDGTDLLGFVLVVARSSVVKVVRVSVPVKRTSPGDGVRPQASWGPRPSSAVKADAGDDQVGLVGHRVTLNGARSVPGDGKTARWVQVAGPTVVAPEHQGAFFSFVPGSPGTYRFLLVVAADGEVSEPDEVSVLVGSPPTNPVAAFGFEPAAAAFAATPPPAPAPLPPPPPSPEQILERVATRLPDAPRVSHEVADVMEAVAERTGLYTSFGTLHSELARRLDVVVPGEPDRTAWVRDVFDPLTAYTARQLLPSGIDLSQPQGVQQTLTSTQQGRLHDHFLNLARAFRAVPMIR